jgi:fucose permease
VAEVDHLTAPALRRSRAALTVIFLLNGLVFASWTPQLPALREQLDIGMGELGLVLLGPPVGFLFGTRSVRGLVERCGSGRTTRVIALVYALSLLGPTLAGSAWTLFFCLIPIGLTQGALIVAANAHGVMLQDRYGRPILSAFHAFYSLGGMIGAALAGLAVHTDLGPPAHFTAVGVTAAVIVLTLPRLIDGTRDDDRPDADGAKGRRRPSGAVVLLGLLGFLVLVAEGETANWSTVYLRDETGAGSGTAALGYAAFAAAMATGRLISDRLLRRLGPVRFVRIFAGTAATGLLVGQLVETTAAGIAGFAVLGLGLSGLIPVFFSAAGNLPDGTRALSQVVAVSFLGFLAGPPLMGFVAQFTGLRTAFILLAVLIAVIIPAARATIPAAAKEE